MSKSSPVAERQKAYWRKQLAGHIPESGVKILANWIARHRVDFRIVNARKTKHGDFRGGDDFNPPRITINADLNPYNFLVTSIHEFAHYLVWQRYGHDVQPHGQEWKKAFSYLLEGFMQRNVFPEKLQRAIDKHIAKPQAATCSDPHLLRALEQFDEIPPVYVDEIPNGVKFALDGHRFLKGQKQRTRFLCKSLDNGRLYHVHGMAKVKAYERK